MVRAHRTSTHMCWSLECVVRVIAPRVIPQEGYTVTNAHARAQAMRIFPSESERVSLSRLGSRANCDCTAKTVCPFVRVGHIYIARPKPLACLACFCHSNGLASSEYRKKRVQTLWNFVVFCEHVWISRPITRVSFNQLCPFVYLQLYRLVRTQLLHSRYLTQGALS